MPKIIVFSKPGCVQCKATVNHLKRNGLEAGKDFDYFDVTQNEEAFADAEKTGIRSMPVIVSSVGNWGGFNPSLLDTAIAAQARG